MGSKPEEDPENRCDLSESVMQVSDKSGYWGYKLHFPVRWRGICIVETFEGYYNSRVKRECGSCCLRNNTGSAQTIRVTEWIREFSPLLWYGQCLTYSKFWWATKVRRGCFLCHLIDEFEQIGCDSFIEEFVVVVPKNYEYSDFCPSTEERRPNARWCVWTWITKDTAPVHVHNPKKIKRKHCDFLVSILKKVY